MTGLPAGTGDPALDAAIRRVLRHGHTIDITTTGRRTGLPRRIEITYHSFDGHLYISGIPSVGRARGCETCGRTPSSPST